MEYPNFMEEYIRLTQDAYHLGWHEKNAGNLTYRMKDEEVAAMQADFSEESQWQPLEASLSCLGGAYFLVSGTGKDFRDFKIHFRQCAGVIRLNQDGSAYKRCWGFEGNGHPTSELLSHLMMHATRIEAGMTNYRVVYHAHPVNIITVSFLLPLDDGVFTRELWQCMSECRVVFSNGIGVLDWLCPGTKEIADATREKIRKRDIVIWPHHGALCVGESFGGALGLMATVEKAAEVYLKIRSTGSQRLQTITPENMMWLRRHFSLPPAAEFLGEDQ